MQPNASGIDQRLRSGWSSVFLRRFLIALAAIAIGGSAVADSREAREAQTERETIDLLATILREKAGRLHPCALETDWLWTHPVPAETARTHLGSTLDADLIGSHTITRPAALLDPKGSMPLNFCDNDAAKAYKNKALADFRSGELKGEIRPHDPLERLYVRRIAFARPVFDQRLETAVVNVMYINHSWWRKRDSEQDNSQHYDTDGVLKRPSLYGVGMEYVYRKKNGAWQLVSDNNFVLMH